VKDHLLHIAVRYQLASRRQGTHDTKGRAEVNGGGKKPWRQKGTGRARQGTTRAPQWRGGGVVFGPTPRDHGFKLNKKVRRAALCSALSKRVSDNDLIVLDQLAFDAPKTKNVNAFMDAFNMKDALVVLDDVSANVALSARNLSAVTVIPSVGLNVYDVLLRSKLVMTQAAIEAVTARLGGA